MSDIIIAFPNPDDIKVLRSVLVKNGYPVVGAVTLGAKAINLSDDIDYGIVICAYQLIDMQYVEVKENINESCKLLLICSPSKLTDFLAEEEYFLSIPFKAIDLVKTVGEMSDKLYYERKKKKKFADRGDKDRLVIVKAKELLMKCRNMTEPVAHKYLQTLSMESGDTLINTAEKVCLLYGNDCDVTA